MTFIRKNVWTLLARDPWDDVTEDYARRRRHHASAAGYRSDQLDLPGRHSRFVFSAAARRLWNECQHASWFFLPWHRMYLYLLRAHRPRRGDRERRRSGVGAARTGITISRIRATRCPSRFEPPKLPDGTANPLFLAAPRRDPIFVNGGQLPKVGDLTGECVARTQLRSWIRRTTIGADQLQRRLRRARTDAAQRRACAARRHVRRAVPRRTDDRSGMRRARSGLLAASLQHRSAVETMAGSRRRPRQSHRRRVAHAVVHVSR